MQRDMQSESEAPGNQQLRSQVVDTRGKHRILAELKRLEQETRFLEFCSMSIRNFNGIYQPRALNFLLEKVIQDELEQLEKMENASTACPEMLSIVETKPDPLLPVTNGPTSPSWDQWFEGPQDSKGCRCWIL